MIYHDAKTGRPVSVCRGIGDVWTAARIKPNGSASRIKSDALRASASSDACRRLCAALKAYAADKGWPCIDKQIEVGGTTYRLQGESYYVEDGYIKHYAPSDKIGTGGVKVGASWQKYTGYAGADSWSGVVLEWHRLWLAAQAEPEVVEPEVLPAVAGGAAVVPSLVDPARARELQDAVEFHAISFAYARIAYGIELLRLKELVGHGRWQYWYRDNLERPRYALRNCQIYMKAAKAFLAKTQDSAFLGTGGFSALPSPSEMTDKQREAFRAAVAEITTAGTWDQLEMDLGLAREDKPKGGARVRSTPIDPDQKRKDAVAVWTEHVGWMVADVRHPDPCYLLLSEAELKGAIDHLTTVRDAFREALG